MLLSRRWRTYGRLVILAGFLLILTIPAGAEEYVIGREDILKISFWQDPSLDQTVKVRQDGKITLSIIGEITAAGETTAELARKIANNVTLYQNKVSQATVTVLQFNSRKIYVTGQVNEPGKKTFEVIPDIWSVIKEAGGTTELADLTRVSIIRSEEEGGEIIQVNLLEAIAEGNLEKLPKLKSGDTIEVPKTSAGVAGPQLSSALSQRKNLYYIIGQVNQPGVHTHEDGMDIFDAIGQANGPTAVADLKRVYIISKNMDGSTSMTVNVKELHEDGQSNRLEIKPEDTIVLTAKKRSALGWGTIRDFATVASTILSIVLLVD